MTRALPLLVLLIPLGCRGEFDFERFLVAEDSSTADTGSDTGSDTGTDTGTDCPAEHVLIGDGCFGPRKVIGDLLEPRDLAIAAFSGQGKLDLLIAGTELRFFLATGTGDFGAAVPIVGVSGVGVAVGRIDDVALPDFAAVGESIALRVATGGGSFVDAGVIAESGWDGLFADLDGDGDDDLLISGAALRVILTDGGFESVTTLPFAGQGMALADIDDDGDLDLALAGTANNLVRLFVNDGAGGFELASQFTVPMVYDVAFTDLDNDGRPDLLAVNSNDGNVIVLNVTLDFVMTQRSVHAVGRVPRRLALGDIDGDGRVDVVTANRMSGDLSILLGDGSSLATEIRVPTPGDEADQPEAIAVADLDGDGRGEIVMTALATNRAILFGFD